MSKQQKCHFGLYRILFCVLWLLVGSTRLGELSPLVTLTASDASVRDVLLALGRLSSVNMVIDDSVQGKISLAVQNLPFAQVLDLITEAKGLRYEQRGSDVLIVDEAKEKRLIEPLHIIMLHHVRAEEVIDKAALLLRDKGNSQAAASAGSTAEFDNQTAVSEPSGRKGAVKTKKLSPITGLNTKQALKVDRAYESIKIDATTNSLVFRSSDRAAAALQALVEKLDVAAPQVMVEAQIVSIDKQAAEKLGLEWRWSDIPQGTGTNSSNYGGVLLFGRNPQGGRYAVSYAATLEALLTEGSAKLVAKPRIMAVNGKAAFIHVGDTLPIPKTTTTEVETTTSYDYADSGIILTYIPYIQADHFITAEIDMEVSAPTWVSDLKTYQFSKRIASSEVRMADGETIAIAGLMNRLATEQTTKVPILGDIPLIGGLFTHRVENREGQELVIFLTARIMHEGKTAQDSQAVAK
ncbi:MAG: secretin and TonB N-terminal domain-containing protein [Sporomusaceae bacterium]|nr:secretin and TonB N-terminal domain-containing protein [Sporomusaceae bacterium]